MFISNLPVIHIYNFFFCTIFPTYTTFHCWRARIQTHFQLCKARTLQIHLWASTVCQFWLLHTHTVPHGHCCKTTSASNFSPSSSSGSSTWHVYKCKAIIWKEKCWFFWYNVTPNSVMTAGNHSECTCFWFKLGEIFWLEPNITHFVI